jgi:HK97 family phage major capsid protein
VKLKQLQEQYVAKLAELRDLAAKAETDDRDFTADEREEVVRRTEELKALKAAITEAKGDDELRKQIAQLGDDIGLNDNRDTKQRRDPAPAGKGGTIGEQFVNSAEFKGFLQKFPNGRIPDSAKGLMSAPVQFKDIVTGGSDTSGGAFVQTDYTGIYEGLGRRPLTVRDLLSTRQTGSDTVEFVRQVTQSNAAVPVAEATGSSAGTESGDVAGTKPESSMSFLKVTESVRTIAVWVPATKRSLSDASQLRGLIDEELRGDLQEELEDQILTGDGTGENFTGLGSTSGTQSQAYSATVTDLDPLLETTLKAATKVKTVGKAIPTGYLIHPTDWEKIQLARLAKNPNNEATAGSVPTLHGLPVVESQGLTAGTAWVGDFRKAVLWDREQATIQVSDSHSDFFVRNLVAILAEMRAAFGVLRPSAFVEITLDGS